MPSPSQPPVTSIAAAAADPSLASAIDAPMRARDLRRVEAAIERIAEARRRSGDDPELLFEEAAARVRMSDDAEAPLALLARVPRGARRYPAAQETLARLHVRLGDREAALDAARRAIASSPDAVLAISTLAELAPEDAARHLDLLRRAIDGGRLSRRSHILALKTLGRVFDRLDEVDRAFAAFSQANAMREVAAHPEVEQALLEEARRCFTPEFFAARRGHGDGDARPVFILGLPRSGSTLLERILAAHPEVAACGERPDMMRVNARLRDLQARRLGDTTLSHYTMLAHVSPRDAARAARAYLAGVARSADRPQARRLVDKMPQNFALIGAIKLLLPNARILHSVRDMRDVALSCMMQNFRNPLPFGADLRRFGFHAILYRELMDVWRAALPGEILDVGYERVVADAPAEARRALGHLGLAWHPNCAEPHAHVGVVRTASAAEVAKPIHSGAVGRWRRYARHLAPLIDMLERYEALRAQAARAA